MSETPTIDSWHQCYSDGWKGTISDSSFSHPAKFAKGLIFRIIQHALDEGFLKPGDTALDCFGGVGLGGLPCALQGIHHLSVELEPRFVALATGFDCGGANAKHECCPVTEAEGLFGHGPHHVEGNLELWQRLYGGQPQWVQPTMIQGDSRNLKAVLEAADCCLSSPPYSQSLHNKFDVQDRTTRERKAGKRLGGGQITHDRDYGSSPHNLGNLSPGSVDACLSSPPHCHGLGKEHTYADHTKREKDSHRGIMREKGIADPFYGDNPAQLGNMPAGTLDACVASPPFSGTEQPCASQSRGLKDYHAFTRGKGTKRDATHTGETPGQLSAMATGEVAACIASPPHGNSTPVDGRAITDAATHTRPLGSMDDLRHGYGESPAQLATMTTAGFEACVSSPPYSGEAIGHKGADKHPERASHNSKLRNLNQYGGYGETEGQLGHAVEITFWAAAKTILAQVFALLKPGGTAIFVVKSYIRDRQIVDFPHQWERLCHAVGFVTLHEHHALLVDSHSEMGLFGEEVEMYRKSSKSFFRRLCEARGAPEINHETVFCMQKPDMRGVHMEGWEDLPPWMQAYFGSKEDYEAIGPLKGSDAWREHMPPDEAWRQLPLCDDAVSSPPYNLPMSQDHNGTKGGKRGTAPSEAGAFARYGNSAGQLEGLPPGDLAAVISSPPFLGARSGTTMSHPTNGGGPCAERVRSVGTDGDCMGNTPGQLGAMPPGEPLGEEVGK